MSLLWGARRKGHKHWEGRGERTKREGGKEEGKPESEESREKRVRQERREENKSLSFLLYLSLLSFAGEKVLTQGGEVGGDEKGGISGRNSELF